MMPLVPHGPLCISRGLPLCAGFRPLLSSLSLSLSLSLHTASRSHDPSTDLYMPRYSTQHGSSACKVDHEPIMSASSRHWCARRLCRGRPHAYHKSTNNREFEQRVFVWEVEVSGGLGSDLPNDLPHDRAKKLSQVFMWSTAPTVPTVQSGVWSTGADVDPSIPSCQQHVTG